MRRFDPPETNEELSELFGVTVRTTRYWRRWGAPAYVLERLSLRHGTHPAWKGFRILDGEIVTPAGDVVTRANLETHHWLRQTLREEAGRASAAEARLRRATHVQTSANGPTSLDALADLLRAGRGPLAANDLANLDGVAAGDGDGGEGHRPDSSGQGSARREQPTVGDSSSRSAPRGRRPSTSSGQSPEDSTQLRLPL